MLDGLYSEQGQSPPAQAGAGRPSVGIIACGALAHELQFLRLANGWDHVKLHCLDADLHNRPRLIPG